MKAYVIIAVMGLLTGSAVTAAFVIKQVPARVRASIVAMLNKSASKIEGK